MTIHTEQLTDDKIERALGWAESSLYAPALSLNWGVQPYHAIRGWLGRYLPEVNFIVFNGPPTLDTVFHETIHYHQAARGVNFDREYRLLKTVHESDWQAYWNCPLEIEAREGAKKMRMDYCEYIGDPIPTHEHPDLWEGSSLAPWDHPDNVSKSLRSDHTYY